MENGGQRRYPLAPLRRPSGQLYGTATVMVSEATERFPASRASFYLYVENADASTDRAVAAGATLIMETADMPYGDRQSGVVDPSGNIWWISQRLVEEPYAA